MVNKSKTRRDSCHVHPPPPTATPLSSPARALVFQPMSCKRLYMYCIRIIYVLYASPYGTVRYDTVRYSSERLQTSLPLLALLALLAVSRPLSVWFANFAERDLPQFTDFRCMSRVVPVYCSRPCLPSSMWAASASCLSCPVLSCPHTSAQHDPDLHRCPSFPRPCSSPQHLRMPDPDLV